MNVIYLERREPEDNIHRFYEIDIGQDLFGAWCVPRRWGRIGTRGRSLNRAFECERGAKCEVDTVQLAKLGSGNQA